MHDPEILALNRIYEALKNLDNNKVFRIVQWLKDRLDLDEESSGQPMLPASEESPVEAKALRKSNNTSPSGALEVDSSNNPEKKKTLSLSDFKTEKELFAAVSPKRPRHKILLLAAYLQECKNTKDITSEELNARLRQLDIKVNNISKLITNLILQDPPEFVLVKKSGLSRQSRRRVQVTEEGLKNATSFLRKAKV